MTEPSDEIREAHDEATTLRAIRRRLGPAERATLGALCGVGVLFVAVQATSHVRTERARAALLEEQAQLAASVPRADLVLPERIADEAVDLAKEPWAGDKLSPRLANARDAAAIFAETGVYLRLASTMTSDAANVHLAAKSSTKDALSTCLLLDLRAPDQDPMAAATACEPGTGCLGDRTGNLHNLRELHRGLDIVSETFREDVTSADAMALYALSSELVSKRDGELAASAAIAKTASYALVVVDEVPKDLALPWFASSLEAVETVPHAARVAVFDAKTGETLLRVRLDAGRSAAALPVRSAALDRQVQSCGLGMDVATFVEQTRMTMR